MGRLTSGAVLPRGEPFFCVGFDTLRVIAGLRGVVDTVALTVPALVLVLALSSAPFFPASEPKVPVRRVAGTALLVSRCTKGFAAMAAAAFGAGASPGFGFFYQMVRNEVQRQLL